MKRRLDAAQRGVLRGMLGAAAISIAAIGAAMTWPAPLLLPDAGFPAALAHALQWDFLLAACLAFAIARLARHRFLTPQDIDGSALSAGTDTARLQQALLQNTLEQIALALPLHAAWAASMPLRTQAAVPAAALLFVAGRILFFRGYARGAPGRALGFALTFYPSLLLALMLAARLAALALQRL